MSYITKILAIKEPKLSFKTTYSNTNNNTNIKDLSNNTIEEVNVEEYTISTSKLGPTGADGTKYYLQPDGSLMSVDDSYVRYVIKDNSQDIISLSEIFGISANVILEANKDIISDRLI